MRGGEDGSPRTHGMKPDLVFRRWHSERRAGALWQNEVALTPANRLIHKFLSDEFSRQVSCGDEEMYKVSVAISELFQRPIDGLLHLAENRFAGIVYPALALRAHSDNLALLPNFLDRYLKLERIEYMHADERIEVED